MNPSGTGRSRSTVASHRCGQSTRSIPRRDLLALRRRGVPGALQVDRAISGLADHPARRHQSSRGLLLPARTRAGGGDRRHMRRRFTAAKAGLLLCVACTADAPVPASTDVDALAQSVKDAITTDALMAYSAAITEHVRPSGSPGERTPQSTRSWPRCERTASLSSFTSCPPMRATPSRRPSPSRAATSPPPRSPCRTRGRRQAPSERVVDMGTLADLPRLEVGTGERLVIAGEEFGADLPDLTGKVAIVDGQPRNIPTIALERMGAAAGRLHQPGGAPQRTDRDFDVGQPVADESPSAAHDSGGSDHAQRGRGAASPHGGRTRRAARRNRGRDGLEADAACGRDHRAGRTRRARRSCCWEVTSTGGTTARPTKPPPMRPCSPSRWPFTRYATNFATGSRWRGGPGTATRATPGRPGSRTSSSPICATAGWPT